MSFREIKKTEKEYKETVGEGKTKKRVVISEKTSCLKNDSDLQEIYKKTFADFQKEFQIKNIFQVPRLEKIVLNVGAGEAIHNAKVFRTHRK